MILIIQVKLLYTATVNYYNINQSLNQLLLITYIRDNICQIKLIFFLRFTK